ncbi:MAG: hypothetical protein K2L64_03860, partial [Ureaplasma sp.]|nr:hypothetical protein [Ureaplasma sp.]
MIIKLDDCFGDCPKQIIEGINVSMKLIQLNKDFNDDYYENWTFLLFPILTSLEGLMKLSLSNLGIN